MFDAITIQTKFLKDMVNDSKKKAAIMVYR